MSKEDILEFSRDYWTFKSMNPWIYMLSLRISTHKYQSFTDIHVSRVSIHGYGAYSSFKDTHVAQVWVPVPVS